MGMMSGLPWWGKMGIKMALSRLPMRYGFWRGVGVFRAGDMDSLEHALQVFNSHFSRAQSIRSLKKGFIGLELGPGDSLLGGVIAKAFGAEKTYLIDEENLAIRTPHFYLNAMSVLKRNGMDIPLLSEQATLEDIMEACHIVYLTKGVQSFRSIPEASVNFCWSNVVFEHVARKKFPLMMRELRRVMKQGGVCSHSIDLRDHLSGGLNHLRFSEAVWEHPWMTQSGFYTNRFRFTEILDIFEGALFRPVVVNIVRWESLPLERRQMADSFRIMEERDLLVKEFEVLLEIEAEGG